MFVRSVTTGPGYLMMFSRDANDAEICSRRKVLYCDHGPLDGGRDARKREVHDLTPNMSILDYNGSLVMAMAGKTCVAIASDLRLGNQALNVATFDKLDALREKPFIAAADLLGCLNFTKDFVVAGTASSELFGIAEGLYTLTVNAVDRHTFSGWGVVVHVITPDRVITWTLKGRMD
ncbi:hypothetical protein JB92DRAFT_2825772 [Gautieria morchelliformis]|nr:hypothetical protein JB92DRAFT_2825772 [Gautieria morchelliformis]